MSSSGLQQYVIAFRYNETNLSHLLKLSSAMAAAGFSTTLNDSNGHPHELGSNNFGMVTALTPEELKQQAQGVGELVLGEKPAVEVMTFDAFTRQEKSQS